MQKLIVLVIMVAVLLMGYAMHKLIRKFINPRDSVNHAFLFFLAHFIGVFIIAFISSLGIIKFARFLFQG